MSGLGGAVWVLGLLPASWEFGGFPPRPSLLVLGFDQAPFLSELVTSQTYPLSWHYA